MKLKEFILGLQYFLIKENLKFVVIRNYEKLPAINIGNDIDVIVNKNDVNLWIEILREFTSLNNLNFTVDKQLSYCTATTIDGVIDCPNNQLKIDLNNDFNWRGVDFYSTDKLVENAKLFNKNVYTGKEIYINWYVTFCHSFLYGGFINPKYIENFRIILKDFPVEFKQLLNSTFSKKQTNYLLKKINSEIYQVPKKKAYLIRVSIILKCFFRKPINTSYKIIKSFIYDWK